MQKQNQNTKTKARKKQGNVASSSLFFHFAVFGRKANDIIISNNSEFQTAAISGNFQCQSAFQHVTC